MEKEQAEPVTLDDLKKNVEKTHGGASAVAAENPAGEERNKEAKTSQKLHSDKTVQGQNLVNEQPMDKQQPANRPAGERGAGHQYTRTAG